MGYVYRKEHQCHLSRLGRLLLERHDNALLLAKGVARAKRSSYLRCNGWLWLRCRCEKFWVAGHGKMRVPFPVGAVVDYPHLAQGVGLKVAGVGPTGLARPHPPRR